MKLTILTPERKIAENIDVDEVFVPGSEGEMNLLPGHAPLMATLRAGLLRYRLAGKSQEEVFVVSWGYCQVNPQGVNVLVETAESAGDVDRARASHAEKKAIEMLADPELDASLIVKYTRKLERAQLRLQTHDHK